jgi:hypothetical protein
LLGVKLFKDNVLGNKKADLRRLFCCSWLNYLAAGAAASAAGAEAAGAATAGAAAGASTAGAGAGLLQATKVTAKTAAIRAERVMLLISHRRSYKKMANP